MDPAPGIIENATLREEEFTSKKILLDSESSRPRRSSFLLPLTKTEGKWKDFLNSEHSDLGEHHGYQNCSDRRVAPYAAVACIVSYLMTGHRSVYPSQVLSQAKSSSLRCCNRRAR